MEEEPRTGRGSATAPQNPGTGLTAPSTEACRPTPSPVTSKRASLQMSAAVGACGVTIPLAQRPAEREPDPEPGSVTNPRGPGQGLRVREHRRKRPTVPETRLVPSTEVTLSGPNTPPAQPSVSTRPETEFDDATAKIRNRNSEVRIAPDSGRIGNPSRVTEQLRGSRLIRQQNVLPFLISKPEQSFPE